MNKKHTPGPWHVANGVQIRSARDQIAKVWSMRNGEGNANARLIAAAPELLASLQVLVENGGIGPESMFDDAREAIFKATGETT